MASKNSPETDSVWLEAARRAIVGLGEIFGFTEFDAHPGPLVPRCINISWSTQEGLSYISLALPDDGVAPHVYCKALTDLLYGE